MSLTPLGARRQVGYGLGRTDALPLGKLVLDISLSQANYSGGQYLDVSGYGNHGTPEVEPSFETDHNGIANGATTFDGENQYITVADDDSLNAPNDGLTILVWVKITDSFSNRSMITVKWNAGSTDCQYIVFSPPGTRYFDVYLSDTSLSDYVLRRSVVISNGWRHLASQWDGEFGGDLSLNNFVDGSLSNGGIWNTGFTGMTENSLPLAIGAMSGGEYKFSGAISRVQIYRRGLTSDEIADLYSST